MKFLADMGISPYTVRFLRDLGHDAVHLHEQGLDRLPDIEIQEKARLEERIILTNDLDFSNIAAASRISLPSVIIFRLKDMRPVNVNEYLKTILASQSNLLSEGAILSVTEKRIRARQLPLR